MRTELLYVPVLVVTCIYRFVQRGKMAQNESHLKKYQLTEGHQAV
jgi:hypothetical protein